MDRAKVPGRGCSIRAHGQAEIIRETTFNAKKGRARITDPLIQRVKETPQNEIARSLPAISWYRLRY